MVRNDLKPNIEATLTYKDGSVVNLTNATVKFHMKKENGAVVVNKDADVTEALNGKVVYYWAEGDTDLLGKCKGEFEVTFPDSTTQTFPAVDEFDIIFREEHA